MKSKIWLGIEIIAALILVVLIVFFVKRKIEDRKFIEEQTALKGTISSVKIVIKADSDTNEKENLKKIRDDNAINEVTKLREKHPSIIGIIEIPGTDVLYPIVQGEDNIFYLDHDKDGNYHPFGEVYLDSRNDSNFNDSNSVIYGHNIRSAKTIFNSLLKYSEQDYLNAHKKIIIYTLEGYKEYEIFTVFKTNPEEPYREMNFSSKIDFMEFVNRYKSLSMVETKEINGENIITLSTCFDNNSRFVIQAMKIE